MKAIGAALVVLSITSYVSVFSICAASGVLRDDPKTTSDILGMLTLMTIVGYVLL